MSDTTIEDYRAYVTKTARTKDPALTQSTWLADKEDWLTRNMLKAWLANDNKKNLQSATSPVAS